MFNLVIRTAVFVLLVVYLFGFALPFLISAKSSVAVITGITMITIIIMASLLIMFSGVRAIRESAGHNIENDRRKSDK